MTRRCVVVLIGLLALSRISGMPVVRACSSRASAPQHVKDSIDSWARENYDRALDLVLQGHCAASKGVRWISCIRIVPGYSAELEYSLSVEKRYDGTVVAHIIRPKTQSVCTQLLNRKRDRPHASLNALTRLIKLESQAGDQGRFPELVGLADEFEKIRFSPVPPDEIMMDATQYRFRVRSFSGDQMELALAWPRLSGPRSAPNPNPMGRIRKGNAGRRLQLREPYAWTRRCRCRPSRPHY